VTWTVLRRTVLIAVCTLVTGFGRPGLGPETGIDAAAASAGEHRDAAGYRAGSGHQPGTVAENRTGSIPRQRTGIVAKPDTVAENRTGAVTKHQTGSIAEHRTDAVAGYRTSSAAGNRSGLAAGFRSGTAGGSVSVAASRSLAAAKIRSDTGGKSRSGSTAGSTRSQSRQTEIYALRMHLYERIAMATGMPWYMVAAVDQYERTLSRARPNDRPVDKNALSGVYVPPRRWAGMTNPDVDDTHPVSIRFFGGIGRDLDGDGRADLASDDDRLYSVARLIAKYGSTDDDFAIGLWEYYQQTRAVQRVQQFAKIYAAFDRLDLNEHVFPLPPGTRYSYRSTWGTRRSWGGARIHEGTDIFAPYGTPVRSTCYGIVETKGWNRYGGWRIGIRDLDNLYHYFAHLSGYDKNLKPGDIVRPGQVIGWVGSSGYGKPGTQGKFPPHLHYGIYRDRGWVEWAFDPYPLLKKWEREAKKRTGGAKHR